jgi:ABC-2 type transport system ATP-binding protein
VSDSTLLMARALAARYGKREVFHDVTFEVRGGQALGVIGPSGTGKTTLLRTLVGLLQPSSGHVRLDGLEPRHAARRRAVAYFAGEATLPGNVRASEWGKLGTGEAVTEERRRMRLLSRGTRQLLGLRTVLGRQHLRLVVLDEPWEGLDSDGARWLSTVVETKRDRGAAVVLSSHRLHDLAGVCDAYLFLVNHTGTLMRAQEITSVGPVTAATLASAFDRLRGGRAFLDHAFNRIVPLRV